MWQNRQAYPLSRQLDADAGELVLRKIEQMGVKVLTNMDVHRITSRTEEDGHQVFTGFELSDGSILEADLVSASEVIFTVLMLHFAR